MPEPRVLLLTPDFPPAPGGIQLVAHRLAVHSTRVRTRVVALASRGAADFDAREPLDVRRVGGRRLPHRARVLALNARAVREALAFRPQAVLSAHIVTSPAARAIRRLTGAAVVQYLHADEMRARPGLAASATGAADAVIAVSAYTERLALDAGADAACLHRIPNGVDAAPPSGAARAAEPTVLTVSRLGERYKGHDVMMRAMPLVRARVPGARWVVVGDGPLRPHLERLGAAHGLNGHVQFAGELPDAERDGWLDRAHVFAMPSRLPPGGVGGEGFGIAYLEASAHGLPVVAGNVGGAPDAVLDGETGVLVDPSDHVALADAISGLLLDPERAGALGRAGAARARELAWPEIARRVEDVVLEAIGARR